MYFLHDIFTESPWRCMLMLRSQPNNRVAAMCGTHTVLIELVWMWRSRREGWDMRGGPEVHPSSLPCTDRPLHQPLRVPLCLQLIWHLLLFRRLLQPHSTALSSSHAGASWRRWFDLFFYFFSLIFNEAGCTGRWKTARPARVWQRGRRSLGSQAL